MDEWLTGASGTRLFVWRWMAVTPIASVIIIHGIGEHSGRYERLAGELAQAGLAVCAYDQRGHGRSDGRRGHVRCFSEYLDDVDRVAAWARHRAPCPLFVLGHSLGGLVALHAAARRPALADGLILSSPACGMGRRVPAWQDAAARAASVAWPTLALRRARSDGACLSHDPAIGPAYVADPLVHFRITARCYTEVLTRMRGAPSAAAAMRWPALIFQAGDDHLVDAPATRAVFNALGSTDKQLVWLEGWYHEVFNEVERAQVVARTIAWIRTHVVRSDQTHQGRG